MSDSVNHSHKDVNLVGQVAVVTGAGRGLGRAFAQAMASAGAAVAVTARTEAELAETVRQIQEMGGTAMAFTVDVTDRPAMQRTIAYVESRFGPIDILVNNAAVITPLGYDWEVDLDEWWRTLEINLRGPFLCTQLVLPGMMARGSGRIVNVSSGAAYTVHPYDTAYCASKAALSHWTNLLAAGVQPYGVRVFALAPGGATAMLETLATSRQLSEEVRATFRTMLENASDAIEVSTRMLMFLVSGQVDVLTGRHIEAWVQPDHLLQRADDIVRDDVFTLRLRELE